MHTVGPGETITIAQSGIPTGQVVGYQVIKAVTGSISIGRTTTGVVERPSGSGNYVATFITPSEADLYIIVLDWSDGVLSPATSVTEEMQVTTAATAVDTGLGEIADYVKTFLGGEIFVGLVESPSFGPSHISLAIDVVKNRTMTVQVPTVDEGTLPSIVLSYLGKLAALELRQAVISLWSDKAQSRSFGNDSTENVSYASREAMLKMLFDGLLAAALKEQQLALKLMPSPRLDEVSAGPAIDEQEYAHVTRDPRQFPREHEYPYRDGDVFVGAGPKPGTYGP